MSNDASSPLRYRLLTGPDDADFCKRVSRALEEGYELYNAPTMTYNPAAERMFVSQAVIWKGNSE